MATRKNTAAGSGRPVYRTNGAAAYDVNYIPRTSGSAARPLEQPGVQPKHRKQPVKRPKVKARLTIAPLAVVGMLAAACMLVLVLCGYVQLYEQTSRVSELENQLAEAESVNARLQSIYDGRIDLNTIEEKASQLGMTAPNQKQIVYLSIEGKDRAVIVRNDRDNIFRTAYTAVAQSIQTLLEYIR